MLTDFGTYSVGLILGSYISWIEHSSEAIKACNPFALISLFGNRYEKESVNRMNDGQANH